MDKSLRILIVDDDQNMTRTLADILAVSGYVAETAACAEEGLSKLEANAGIEHRSFDCVVSDIRMPGMNGVEFQRVIREKYGLPVMLITAYAEQELIVKAREQGAVTFLEKPLNIPLLFSFLRRIASVQNTGSVQAVEDRPCVDARKASDNRPITVGIKEKNQQFGGSYEK